MNGVSGSARGRVLALLALALSALVARALAGSLGAPPALVGGLYLFALASLVACVLVVATD